MSESDTTSPKSRAKLAKTFGIQHIPWQLFARKSTNFAPIDIAFESAFEFDGKSGVFRH